MQLQTAPLNVGSDVSEHADPTPLGTYAGFASAPVSRQKLNYHLQSLAVKLLPDEKISDCHRKIAPECTHVQIRFNPATENARYKNLINCDRRNICPVCAARLSEQDRREMLYAISNSGYRVAMFTYTLRHNIHEKLTDVYNAMKEAFRFMKSGRRWADLKAGNDIIGCIRAREFTHGDNGWHCHIHELMLFPAATPDYQVELVTIVIKKLWSNALEKLSRDASWERGVTSRIGDDDIYDYVSKFGHEPVESKWTVEHEITKPQAKIPHDGGRNMWQLLADYGDGDKQAGALFCEYARATKGDHALQWSPGLKDLLGIVGGEEIDGENAEIVEAKEIVLAELNHEQYRVIVRANLRYELLETARKGDSLLLWCWLYSHHVKEVINIDLNDVMNSPPMKGLKNEMP